MTKENLSLPLIYAGLLFAALLSTVWLYWSGLYGVFIFDDSPNLGGLANIGKIDVFNDMLVFMLEGTAGSLGRPLSLLTFALQFQEFPYPWWFKYINLLIHLLNGCLIFWLVLILTRLMKLSESRSLLLAFITASLWLLHPIQVSTVLYVVQRMTQLATLFTLAGLLVYLHGRQRLAQGFLTSGFFWVSIGVGLFGILATLSKENGVLLVLYIIVIEATILAKLAKPRYWQLWCAIFLYLPLMLLVGYFATHVDNILRTYEIRDFTLGERLLTETRILVDYLIKIGLPRPRAFGLFHDDYTVSHDLFTPLTTLFTTSFIIISFSLAIQLRRMLPVFAFGILWFLAGHMLESSFLGLVLYFDHRNYLPLLSILFMVSYGVMWLYDHVSTLNLRKLTVAFSGLWLMFVPTITWLEVEVWGNPVMQAALWAEQSPFSRYAQSNAASLFAGLGQFPQAYQYYKTMATNFPQDSAPYLLWLAAACLSKEIPLPDIQKITEHLKTSKLDTGTPSALETIIEQYDKKGQCEQLSANTIDTFFDLLLANPKNAFYAEDLYMIYAKFAAQKKDYAKALLLADKAIAIRDSFSSRIRRLYWLLHDHRYTEALVYIEQTRSSLNMISKPLYLEQLAMLEQLVYKLREIQSQMPKERPLP